MSNYNRTKIQQILARNTLRYMGENGVSVPELASACEVTPSSMKQLLAGQQFISSRTLANVCNALSVTPDMLFVDSGADNAEDAEPDEE